MLDHGADTPAAPGDNSQSLIAATRNGNLDAAEVLLRQGACLDCGDANGRTPLWYAADQGNSKLVKIFLTSPSAAAGTLVHQVDKDNYTSLHRAAMNGDIEVINLLLKNDADVNARAAGDNTPLLLAAREGHRQATNRLLLAGAGVDARNAQGNTALMLAAGNGKATVVKILLEHNANPSLRNQQREQAVDIANNARHPEIAILLKEQAPAFWR